MAKFRIAELFAGMGGVTGGLLDTGHFRPVVLIDCDPYAAHAFKQNFPQYAAQYHLQHVNARLTARMLLDMAGDEIDGLLGCPPCQGFSPAGKRDNDDARNALLYDMRRLIRTILPQFFIMENVPSLLNSTYYQEFETLLSLNYDIHGEVVNAAEYGVPQLRRRAVVIGFRKDLGVKPSLPAPTHGGRGQVFDYRTGQYIRPRDTAGRLALQLRPRVEFGNAEFITLERAIGDLRRSVPTITRTTYPEQCEDEGQPYAMSPRTAYQRMMRVGQLRVRNHKAWGHGPQLTKWLDTIEPGDCPNDNGSRGRNTTYYSQAYGRLHPDGLARTITTNFHNPGGGRFTHYDVPRTLTIREALRVQSFPDSFHLNGMHASHAERLVGNAFPRLLAEVIGRHVVQLLS